MIKAITTAHPVPNPSDMAQRRRLCTSDGFRFEDADRCVRVWHRDAYVGRVPYEAIVMIEEDGATKREECEATNRSYHPDAVRAQALGLTGDRPVRQQHGKHKRR